jgi:hypothetical protein
MFYCPELGRFLARDMIRRPGANPYVYAKNSPLKYVDPTGLWEAGGHYYTSYLVSKIAASRGISINPEALAYYSQLPDVVEMFEATPEAIESLGQGFATAVGSGAAGGIGGNPSAQRIRDNQWAYDIFEVLHSLHGGDANAVMERRDCLKNFLRNLVMNGAPDWQIGFTIHALGDAFAHTYRDETGLHAFGWPFGHGSQNVSGTSPDSIGLSHAAYSGYVDALYEGLSGMNANYAVTGSLGAIKNAGLKAGLPSLRNWAAGKPIDVGAESEAMRQYAISQGLSDEYNPLISGRQTFDSKYRTPTRDEVRQYLDALKKACVKDACGK